MTQSVVVEKATTELWATKIDIKLGIRNKRLTTLILKKSMLRDK